MKQEVVLAELLELWLDRPDEERTEVKMFGFAFEAAANPRYRFSSLKDPYPLIRDHLYDHGNIFGPSQGKGHSAKV